MAAIKSIPRVVEPCPGCGAPKCKVAKLCWECRDKSHTERLRAFTTCETCGGKKMRYSKFPCRKCLSAKRSTEALARRVCPDCGKRKDKRSLKCKKCGTPGRPRSRVTLQCPVCKTLFEKPFSTIGRTCCSIACKWALIRKPRKPVSTRRPSSPRIQLACAWCGKMVTRTSHPRSKRVHVFCSVACLRNHHVGERHPAWKGGKPIWDHSRWRIWRRAVFKLYGRRCRWCGEQPRVIEAHHIFPRSTHRELSWEVSNGIPLCHPCHLKTRYRELEFAPLFARLLMEPSRS